MTEIIICILGIVAGVIGALAIPRLKEYSDTTIRKKYEEKYNKMSDDDIVDELPNTDDVRGTIDNGKRKVRDLFQRKRMERISKRNRKDTRGNGD